MTLRECPKCEGIGESCYCSICEEDVDDCTCLESDDNPDDYYDCAPCRFCDGDGYYDDPEEPHDDHEFQDPGDENPS